MEDEKKTSVEDQIQEAHNFLEKTEETLLCLSQGNGFYCSVKGSRLDLACMLIRTMKKSRDFERIVRHAVEFMNIDLNES